MGKIIAILNVIAWSGFWAFGYLALSADPANTGQVLTAILLAALGAGLGLWAYLQLVRISEDRGLARRPNRAVRSYLEDEINGGAI